VTNDEKLLRRAIELAAEARAGGNPPFGSLLADQDGGVLVEERNTTITDADISLHPELKLAVWAARERRDGRMLTTPSGTPASERIAPKRSRSP
jgi:tRNA(Arg) A34 adenosine deaminase TadA